jgi:hypothetical protein
MFHVTSGCLVAAIAVRRESLRRLSSSSLWKFTTCLGSYYMNLSWHRRFASVVYCSFLEAQYLLKKLLRSKMCMLLQVKMELGRHAPLQLRCLDQLASS